MNKIAISAPFHFSDFKLLKSSLNSLLTSSKDLLLCSDTTSCISCLQKYAVENELELKLFMADWNKYGAIADKVRDQQMMELADELLLFNDGENKRTDFLKSQANQKGLTIHEIKINPNKTESGTTYTELDKLNSFEELSVQLSILEDNKTTAIKQMNYELAASLRDKIRFVNQKLESLN